VPKGSPEECPNKSPVPATLQDKVSSLCDNLPCPYCSPRQGLLMVGQPALSLPLSRTRSLHGGTTCPAPIALQDKISSWWDNLPWDEGPAW